MVGHMNWVMVITKTQAARLIAIKARGQAGRVPADFEAKRARAALKARAKQKATQKEAAKQLRSAMSLIVELEDTSARDITSCMTCINMAIAITEGNGAAIDQELLNFLMMRRSLLRGCY